MSRWMVFLPLGILLLAGGAMALLLGKRAATTTEIEVIERVADRYMREGGAGARRSDCAARPAMSEALWLVVLCRAPNGTGVDYFIDRFGRVRHTERIYQAEQS